MQSDLASLEKKRAAAASERAAATTKRAKAEVDVSDLEEQMKKHEETKVDVNPAV